MRFTITVTEGPGFDAHIWSQHLFCDEVQALDYLQEQMAILGRKYDFGQLYDSEDSDVDKVFKSVNWLNDNDNVRHYTIASGLRVSLTMWQGFD